MIYNNTSGLKAIIDFINGINVFVVLILLVFFFFWNLFLHPYKIRKN